MEPCESARFERPLKSGSIQILLYEMFFLKKSERRIRFNDDCDDHGRRARQTFILEMHHLIQDPPTDGRCSEFWPRPALMAELGLALTLILRPQYIPQ